MLRPKPDEVFYHYCSVESFRLICEQKTLRFSDVNMLNDYHEATWGYRIFEEAATRMLRGPVPDELKGLDKKFFDEIDEIFSPSQLYAHPVVCSFSKAPDVLSQWRAYANDGTGVAVGFSGQALKAMPATLLDVEYDKERQINDMIDTLTSLYLLEVRKNHPRDYEFRSLCLQVATFGIAFKNPAFSEEDEVRSIHVLAVETDGGVARLVDEGGFLNGKTPVDGVKVKFRTRDDALIAYVDIPFVTDVTSSPIKEVWLGPKNTNWPTNIAYVLANNGFKDFKIHASKASYR